MSDGLEEFAAMTDLSWVTLLYDFVYKVTFNLTVAILAPLKQTSELHWIFLLSTIMIAWTFWRYSALGAGFKGVSSLGEFRRRFLSRDTWWHPSARLDYRFYLVNAVVVPVVMGPIWINDINVSAWLTSLFGAGQSVALDPALHIAVRVLYTLLFFIVYDFGRFVAHSLLHDVPWLWEFHKVHHSAEVLTPVTTFRFHPIDLAVMSWVPALLTGLLTWGFHRFVDSGIGVYMFLGLHVMIWAFNLIDNLRHSHVWVSYGDTLNRWLISPAHHQLHHSLEERHWGCNRGSDIALWDRLYGTLIVPSKEPEQFRMGLTGEPEGSWTTMADLYVRPFGNLLRRLRRTKPALRA